MITVLQAICRSDFGEMREDAASRIKLRGSDTRLLAEMGMQGSGVRGGSGNTRRLYSGDVSLESMGRKGWRAQRIVGPQASVGHAGSIDHAPVL